jgi:hypothetical protein
VRGQRLPIVIGLDVESPPGLSLGREDTLDGIERISAEADGPLESGQPVGPRVGGQQGEHFEALSFAVALAGQQSAEEAKSVRPEFGEALAEHGFGLSRFGVGPMLRQHGTLAGHAPWEQTMAGDLVDLRAVDDQFGFADAYR